MSVAAKLGIGLLAGLAGTIAMTASQEIEMRLRGREPSLTPAKAAEKVLHVHPDDEATEKAMSEAVHFAYGTGWGAFRSGLDLAGLRGLPASAIHFVAILSAGFVMLPRLEVAPPVKTWGAPAIAIDMLHHAVYALAAGLTYDGLSRSLRTGAPLAVERQAPAPVLPIAAGLAALALRRSSRKAPEPPKLRVTSFDRPARSRRERLGVL